MNYFLTIIIAGMMLTTQVHAMTESALAVPDAKTSAPTDAGADAKKSDAKDVALYKEKAQEFITDIAQNLVAYEHVYCGMQAVKKACEKADRDSFSYAFMTEKKQKSWDGKDKIFVKIYGLKFAAVVQDVACKKLGKTLTELSRIMLGKGGGKEYFTHVQPHMLALANAMLVLLEPHVSVAKL